METDLGDGLHLLGTSGQNVHDIMRNTSGLDSAVDVMRALLSWRHLAPTCPDTLACFPYREEDPFILDKLPHVLFAANQDKFEQG